MKTGNVKTVAALDKVLQICNAHGASYNPGNDSLQPTALRSLLEQAQEKTEAVNVTRTTYRTAIHARSKSVAGIQKLAAQVVRMVSVSKVSAEDKAEAKLINRRFQSVSKKKDVRTSSGKMISQAESEPGQSVKRKRPISQLDRDGIMNNFHQLITLVERLHCYKPNEEEFKVESLKAKLAQLRNESEAATQEAINSSNARIARDQVLYGPDGVEAKTREAKDYIRAKFGVRSQQSMQTRPSMNF
jgi:hypothetical protein